nr:MAG TPA: hypothetical protein [Caudoviricetes sp.]
MVLYNHNILTGKILFNRNKTMLLCQLYLLSSSMVEQE